MSSPLFTTLRKETKPSAAVKNRIYGKIQRRISPAEFFCAEVQAGLATGIEARKRVWLRVARRIQTEHALSLLERLREIATPPAALRARLFARILPCLQPVIASTRMYRPLKWAASFALFALAVRVAPFLILAEPTVADSAVTLLPTRGEVSVSVGGMWQPVTDEFVLEPGTILRTGDGEASILFHDDGVLRLDANTTVMLHDTAKRFGSSSSDVTPTFALYTGRLWVQGLVPTHVQGLAVATSYGTVLVNEGSLSVAEDEAVDVEVFDRRATVLQGGDEIVLVAGERTRMWEENIPLVKRIANERYDESWTEQNLARDAVHRREIAQLQQERRAAMAGILPTSRLYPVKRAAEAVDVLLTFGEDARTQKRLTYANTRLNEAAALLAGDQGAQAAEPLAEYRAVLLALADGSEEGTLTQFLLEQSLSEASADMAAALPDDAFYLLKQAVLEASVEIDGAVTADDIQGLLIMDALAALIQTVEAGEVEGVQKAWVDLQPHLALTEQEDSKMQEGVHKEILALLTRFALAVQEHEEQIAAIDPELVDQLAAYLPSGSESAVPVMSEEELQILVQSIYDRIFLYHMTRSRVNQFFAEVKALAGHPEEGRILRRLYVTLPDGPEQFPSRVRREITNLRWAREGGII